MQAYILPQAVICGATMPDGVYQDEGRRLRALANNPLVRVKFRPHALDEMAKDNISILTVRNILKRCRVEKSEQNRFEEAWTAVGNDVDGNRISIVVVAYEDTITIKVITAWKNKR
jgi:hypothetical protein